MFLFRFPFGLIKALQISNIMIGCHLSKESSEIICTSGIRTVVQDFPVELVIRFKLDKSSSFCISICLLWHQFYLKYSLLLMYLVLPVHREVFL